MAEHHKNLICVLISRGSHAKLNELKVYRRETLSECLDRILKIQEVKNNG